MICVVDSAAMSSVDQAAIAAVDRDLIWLTLSEGMVEVINEALWYLITEAPARKAWPRASKGFDSFQENVV